MKTIKTKKFKNGEVFLLSLSDGMLIETTDTFLPYYTKNIINSKCNKLKDNEPMDRGERWMIGVSVMSGCPIKCKICATSLLKQWRCLHSNEIIEQVLFIVNKNQQNPNESKEFKINYTRMGEPFLNIDNIKKAIKNIDRLFDNTHHYISTIGVRNSDYSWITGNITLQISLHAMNDKRRKDLIPYNNLMTIEELGQIRTDSNLKTTLNLTLVNENDFNIEILKKYFDPKYFFIKLSPINKNIISIKNNLGESVIKGRNLI